MTSYFRRCDFDGQWNISDYAIADIGILLRTTKSNEMDCLGCCIQCDIMFYTSHTAFYVWCWWWRIPIDWRIFGDIASMFHFKNFILNFSDIVRRSYMESIDLFVECIITSVGKHNHCTAQRKQQIMSKCTQSRWELWRDLFVFTVIHDIHVTIRTGHWKYIVFGSGSVLFGW